MARVFASAIVFCSLLPGYESLSSVSRPAPELRPPPDAAMTRRRALLSIGLATPLLSDVHHCRCHCHNYYHHRRDRRCCCCCRCFVVGGPVVAGAGGAPWRDRARRGRGRWRPSWRRCCPDPSRGTGATSDALGGTWELIWSAKAEAFSPLLRLPRPLKPESYQLLGGDAEAAGVGSGRVVQVLKGGILGGGGDSSGGGGGSSVASLVPPLAEIWLSSGVAPADGAGDTLEIFPPFRLEVGRGGGGAQSGGRRTTGGGGLGRGLPGRERAHERGAGGAEEPLRAGVPRGHGRRRGPARQRRRRRRPRHRRRHLRASAAAAR